MVLDPAHNAAKAELASAVNSSVTTFTFTAGSSANLPIPASTAEEYNVPVADTSLADPSEDPNYEIVRVTGGSGNDRTVTRGQEGTSGAAHSSGHEAWVAPTKKFRDDVFASLCGDLYAAGTIQLTAGGDLVVPSTVRRGTVTVDSNGASGNDTLVSVSGGVEGQLLILKIANAARKITIQDGATIKTPEAADLIMETTDARVFLHRDGTVWYVIPGFVAPKTQILNAWCLFTGDTTPADLVAGASFGISTLADGGTGKYVLNWATAFKGADKYALVASAENSVSPFEPFMAAANVQAAASATVETWNNAGSQLDCGHASAMAIEVVQV
jgi:hypothetical protein